MMCLAPDSMTGIHLVSAAGGFLGGMSILVYMKPSNLTDALRRIVVGTVAAVFGAEALADKLFGSKDPEYLMMTAFAIGFCAWSLLGAVAKFFEGRQDQDILQMAKSVTEVARPSPYGGYGKSYPTSNAPVVPTPRREQIDSPD